MPSTKTGTCLRLKPLTFTIASFLAPLRDTVTPGKRSSASSTVSRFSSRISLSSTTTSAIPGNAVSDTTSIFPNSKLSAKAGVTAINVNKLHADRGNNLFIILSDIYIRTHR